jgi:CoA:oxalate CoA-transferase
MTDAPLTGVTILDLSRVLSGPSLHDARGGLWARRVIKIEHPRGGDDTRPGDRRFSRRRAYYLSINRNKESVALDFKTPDGRALLGRLVEKADVIVENFRRYAGQAGPWYTQLAERYPRLIYVSISGFGQNGPRRSKPGRRYLHRLRAAS